MQQVMRYKRFLSENPYPRALIKYEQDSFSSVYLKHQGKNLLNFSSSDYLGLAKHPLLVARSKEYAEKFGIGSGSSRLVAGNLDIFETLERDLARALKKPAALILGTGYQTNTTVLEALLDKKVLSGDPILFCDRLIHTSIISSVRHFADVMRFRHNDLDHLQELLEKHHSTSRPLFILVESLYSMDGDQVNLTKLTQLAKEYGAMLYVDDAHSVGVNGSAGWGNAVDYADDVDTIMGTFSKGLGSFGGYIGCSETVKDYLINKCKGLIYSTALPLPVLGAISAAIELVPQLTTARQQLTKHTERVLAFFRENNLNSGASTSHIIPWVIGDVEQALYASELLKQEGILGVTIRPPSVPESQSRIRFCLTAAHEEQHINHLLDAILKVSRVLDNKRKIINRFNAAVETYELAADIQVICAKKLSELLPAVSANKILEIGCGTGLLSQYVIKQFPEANICLSDIASEMVGAVQQRFAHYNKVQTICMDGEALSLSPTYDLIVSATTLHWFSDLPRSLQNITDKLQPGGQFIFSVLGDRTLTEWKKACAGYQVMHGAPHFPSAQLLMDSLPGLKLTTETHSEEYANAHAFLKTLKKIGATATRPGYSVLPIAALRSLLRDLDTPFKVTYEVICGVYQKP